MNQTLQSLIKAFEEDKSNLLQMIDAAVKEEDFLFAHYHSEALQQLNMRLQTLKNFEDEFWDQKAAKLKSIEKLRAMLQTQPSESLKNYLNEDQKVLDRLNEFSKTSSQKTDGNVINSHLELLMGNKLKGFRIMLIQDEGLILEIRRVRKRIRIIMPHVSQLVKNYTLDDEKISKLKGLGLQFNNKRDRLITELTGDPAELGGRIKTLLAVIVFEVFYFRELDKMTWIEHLL